MPTFKVLFKKYGEKKTIYLKLQMLIFFSGVLSMWNQITNKNTDNPAT